MSENGSKIFHRNLCEICLICGQKELFAPRLVRLDSLGYATTRAELL